MNLAVNLKKIRERRGLTQTEVAARIGEGLSYYNKLEKKIMRPSVEILVRLSSLYGLTLDEIVFLTPAGLKKVEDNASKKGKKASKAKAAKPAKKAKKKR